MNRNEMIALAREIAVAHSLVPEIVCGQIERESSWQPWAIRYEDGFFERYIAPLTRAGEGKSNRMDATEMRARAFSWGLGQVMGEVARELGYAGPLAALCDPSIGIEWQCRALAHKLRVHQGNLRDALTSYNGRANPCYADEVFALAEKYRAVEAPVEFSARLNLPNDLRSRVKKPLSISPDVSIPIENQKLSGQGSAAAKK